MKAKAAVITIAIAALVMTTCAAGMAKTGPGPVVLTYMQRVEAQTDVPSPGSVSGETFVYSMLSAFRKLDQTGTTGSIYYINKASIDDGRSLSNIAGLDIGRVLTGKWNLDLGYSYNSNPKRNTVPSNDSDRFNFTLKFNLNPKEKVRKRYTLKTIYSTGTDFSAGRTLAWKLDVMDSISKNWSYDLSYEFLWGLQNIGTAVKKEQYGNFYTADFSYKVSKRQRITLGYMFLNNLFNAATRTGDNNLWRASYFITLK